MIVAYKEILLFNFITGIEYRYREKNNFHFVSLITFVIKEPGMVRDSKFYQENKSNSTLP